MTNPWTKKNALMSIWLSAANKAAAPVRAQAASAVRRQAGAVQGEAGRQFVDFWSGKTLAKTPKRRGGR